MRWFWQTRKHERRYVLDVPKMSLHMGAVFNTLRILKPEISQRVYNKLPSDCQALFKLRGKP